MRRIVALITLIMSAGSKSGAYADYRFGSEQVDGRSSFFARVSINFSAKWLMYRFGK